jgi:uncharacterized protein YndB with AHSA1/START domain
MSAEAPTSVRESILVEAPIERAFEVFTRGISTWWPHDRHILKAELVAMEFEPWVGGNIVDRGVDGSECRWARILAYEPPHRVLFSWDVSSNWQLELELDRTSEVEVRFIAEGVARTRVELEHRHLERHGEGWEEMRAAVGSPEGWMYGLRAFGREVEERRESHARGSDRA